MGPLLGMFSLVHAPPAFGPTQVAGPISNVFQAHGYSFRVGSNRPPNRLNLYVTTIFPLPKSYNEVFHDSTWQLTMCDKYNALIKNNT